jgi:hypothetical protein
VTLEGLLELLRESILNDRTDRVDGSSDYLWTDKTLVTFINEAQRRLAVQGLILRDGTTDEATKVMLVEGQSTYPLHLSVLAVVSAKREDQEADLTRVGHRTLSAYRAPSDNWVDPTGYQGLPAGVPLAYATDGGISDADSASFEQAILRVYPTPNADAAGKVIRLRVVRKPLAPLTVDALQATPEVPEDHHIEMLDYAAYLALRIVDDDAGAPKRAEEFRKQFEENVKNARNIALRKMFAPMGWGFGRGGFTWES